MEQLKKKYLYLISLLTSSSEPSGYLYQKLIIFFLLGVVLIGFGVLAYKIDIFSSGDKVEVITPATEPQDNIQIVVEITGAVENPDVYKMKSGNRVDDLLIISGGLSVDADRNWVEKNINRAGKLVDGQKIHIYSQSEVTSAKDGRDIKLDQGVLGTNNQNLSGLVNINTGSQSELEKLNGIGPVYATNIIEHRPYSNIQELVSKGAISQKILDKIKNDISL